MIYLDYAANTPVDLSVLDCFYECESQYPMNPNSRNPLCNEMKQRMWDAMKQLSEPFGFNKEEIIITGSATEANNLAIKGVGHYYKSKGKHMITSYLEHSSVNGPISALVNEGYEVDYVEVNQNGQVDLEQLASLIRSDTVLVSIGYVDSEIGLIQPIEQIGNILNNFPNCFFHVDATQAIGKIPVNFNGVDLVTYSPHKFYGLNGIGVLLKREKILLETQLHGGLSTTPFRSGTPSFALTVAAAKALSLCLEQLEERWQKVICLHDFLKEKLASHKLIKINGNKDSTPYILNISLTGYKTEMLEDLLSIDGIMVSTKSACSGVNTPSRPVYALTKDKKAAMSTLRISLSHLTTLQELDVFYECLVKHLLENSEQLKRK